MREVTILGATGSIGTQAAAVIAANPDKFNVVGLAAQGSDLSALQQQISQLQPKIVAVADPQAAQALRQYTDVTIWEGETASTRLAGERVDVVLNGITGAVGLEPTLAALDAGNQLALANKESLVVGGSLVKQAAKPGQIVPVDSEHSALAQALRSGEHREVRKLILTASGGPFRGQSREQLTQVTLAQALAHPTWNMGRVVTLNSATLVNKGLELLEAHLLFDIAIDDIAVVVHPQSVVHSMVEFVDGSTIAQCSPPDMKLPIALGLSWPQRVPGVAKAVDWSVANTWTFEPLDVEVFPAVELARMVGKQGATYPAVFNAANEVAVAAFCAGDLPFLGIVDLVREVVHRHESPGTLDLSTVLAADAWARGKAREILDASRRD